MMAPASGFYANSKIKNQVRIAYVLKKDLLEKGFFVSEKLWKFTKKLSN